MFARIHGEMVVKGFLAALAATALVSASPAPALAARAQALPGAPTIVTNPAEADREFVRWLSVHDPRPTVQSAAQAALGGNTATTFLLSGYTPAVTRAAQAREQHLDFANRTAATHPAQLYPWVNAAARRAAIGTDEELAEFATSGFAAALAQDDAEVPYDDGAALVSADDRGVVADLTVLDLGDTVRRRAADVTTDVEVAEFLRHGWRSAAGIDSDTFRAQHVAHEWTQWNDARNRTQAAVAAEQSGDPWAVVQAWDHVSSRFSRQPSAWAEREQFARVRTNAWAWFSMSAGDAESPLQASLAVEAPAFYERWRSEAVGAGRQNEWWAHLTRYARASVQWWLDYTG